ncbi:type IV pilus assembly protein FimV [Acidovorax sp. LjRoot117]|uniref:type IV pilus assembly protein FimV n=1 Tax=Acidovorax sp. LjRoot117 TaxID=3342255 RepID=UPI003ED0A7D7
MKIRNTVLGAGLWVVAAGAGALSLGSSRGTVVLGAPLDVSFEVQPDAGSDVASSCVSAQVRAGDTPIGDARVRITPLPDMRGRPPGVRVQANVAIDEPVLTVTLSAGCSSKISRTYTFLSELPASVARSTAPVDVSRLSSATPGSADVPRSAAGTSAATGMGTGTTAQRAPAGSAPAALPGDTPAAPARPPAAAASRPVPRAAANNAAPARSAQRPPAAAAAAAAPKPAERSRLVVEPLDLWLDRPVALRSSPELLVTPSDQPSAQRAQAAAVWKSLNAQPEDINQDADRLKALEADMATLRAQASRDRASAAQAQQQLEQVQEERFPALVVYVLGGLLAAALLLVAWVLVRMRTRSEKAIRDWRDSVAALGGRDPALAARDEALGLRPHPGDTWLPPDTTPSPVPQAAPAAAPAAQGAGRSSGAAPLAPSMADTQASPSPTAPAPASTAATAAAAAAASASASRAALHIVSPEELFDIQQQAEFFISVGEHQQAIEVLKKHIDERGDVSPLAYLELLRLYHTLSRVEEFAQLRKQFMQSFNAQVPEFTGFHRTGRMLYHYTDALAEIEAEWTSPSVLVLLEKYLFRRDGVGAIEPFDMAAYDELLLLLAIAQTTPASARGDDGPRKRTTPLAPDRIDAVVMPEPSAPPPRPAAPQDDLPLDSLAASLEFDFDESLRTPRAVQTPEPPAATRPPMAPPGVAVDTRGAPLDLDLSEPPHLTLSDLPPVPVTPPPASGGAVGFGMDNDLMELRLELEQKDNSNKGRP